MDSNGLNHKGYLNFDMSKIYEIVRGVPHTRYSYPHHHSYSRVLHRQSTANTQGLRYPTFASTWCPLGHGSHWILLWVIVRRSITPLAAYYSRLTSQLQHDKPKFSQGSRQTVIQEYVEREVNWGKKPGTRREWSSRKQGSIYTLLGLLLQF